MPCFHASGQPFFEKGYFIGNDGNKIECLIQNLNWETTPHDFEFTPLQGGIPVFVTSADVREFQIYGHAKYVSAKVKIDRSSNILLQLTRDRNPEWSEEQLFLNLLVHSRVSLYTYEDDDIVRYFVQFDGSPIQQLVYKRFLRDPGTTTNIDAAHYIWENLHFQQYLWQNFRCVNTSIKTIKDLRYHKRDLMRYFMSTNECNGERVGIR
jgi:hypothetical protein